MKLNNTQKHISPQVKRLCRKARAINWAKSCVWGTVFGLEVSFGYLTQCVLFGSAHIWLAGICFLFGLAVFTPLAYAVRFRQDSRELASEIDALGLDERVITMTQFADIDSPMIRRQRADTESVLQKVKSSHLKARPFTTLNVFLICALLVCNVGSLVLACAIPEPLIHRPKATANKYTVEYAVYGEQGGKILGLTAQEVGEGETAGAVQAVADINWIFVGWSDGVETAYREDKEVKKDFCASAIFMPIAEDDDADDEEMPNYDPDKSGEGGGERIPWQIPSGEDRPNGNKGEDGDGSSGNPTNPSSQVIDGATFIGDIYGSSVSEAAEAASNAGLNGSRADMVGDYFSGIAK